MGTLYQRGKIWWLKYYKNGKTYRESSKSTKKMVATKLLKRREGEIAQGKSPGVEFDKITFDDLAEGFVRDYKINQKKSLVKAERSVRHLKEEFDGVSVSQITTPRINRFIEQRLDDGVSNGTINRELAALKRMMNIGAKQTPPMVDRVPHIPMLEENNARKGFFEYEEFLALRKELPEYLKGVVSFAYKSGWRVSEITGLQWSNVDLQQRVVWLDGNMTKNKEGRTIYLDEELVEVFRRQKEQQKEKGHILPYVFPNRNGDGRIKDFRGAWKTASEKAGIPKRLFHDFRRTAVRNMVRSGIPERVAMMISGHKTRAVFERYNIVNESDLRMASQKQEDYLKAQVGTILGTVAEISTKKGSTKTG